MQYIFQDWQVNRGNPKARIVLTLFRAAQKVRRSPLLQIGIPFLIAYRVGVEWILGIELPWNLKIGPSVRLFHGMGLVINDQTRIGRNVVLRHTTTIGVNATKAFGANEAPSIDDDVDIGAHILILGPIKVGDGAKNGAGSVVLIDVPPGATVVGNPARIVQKPTESAADG